MDPYFGDDEDIYDEDEDYDDEYYYDPDDFEHDDLYDDVGDDYDYDAWHLSCSCRPFHEVLDSYAPTSKSVDNISHIDVFNISHHFTKLVEVIAAEAKDQLQGNELQWIGLNIHLGARWCCTADKGPKLLSYRELTRILYEIRL